MTTKKVKLLNTSTNKVEEFWPVDAREVMKNCPDYRVEDAAGLNNLEQKAPIVEVVEMAEAVAEVDVEAEIPAPEPEVTVRAKRK
jgi:hypothetical protein